MTGIGFYAGLVLAGIFWVWGGIRGMERRPRLIVLGIFWVAVMSVTAALPPANPLRLFLGKSWGLWLATGVVVLGIAGYVRLLARLHDRAVVPPERPRPLFSDAELDRYSRHIILRDLGGPGQKALKQARVLVIGAGGLGSPALMYLAAAGVGTIGVVDMDEVENSNLQRQVIFRDIDIGRSKARAAADAMKAQNPFITVHVHDTAFDEETGAALLEGYDLILDGSDDFDTRYLANHLAAAAGKPLISGALSQWEGQVSVFDPAHGTPCYECIFPERPAPGLAPSCAQAGVLSPLPGVVGSLMAVETVKVITGAGSALRGEMLIYDALWGETRKIALKPRPDCPVCGARHKVRA